VTYPHLCTLGHVEHLLFSKYDYKREYHELERIIILDKDTGQSQFYSNLAPFLRSVGYFERQIGDMCVAREALLISFIIRSLGRCPQEGGTLVLPGGINLLVEDVPVGTSLDGITSDERASVPLRENLYGQPSIIDMVYEPAYSEEQLLTPPPHKPLIEFHNVPIARPFATSVLRDKVPEFELRRHLLDSGVALSNKSFIKMLSNAAMVCSGVINVVDGVAYACWPGTLGRERIDEYLDIIYLTWRYRVQLSVAESGHVSHYKPGRDDRPVEQTSGRTRGNARATEQKAATAAAAAAASSTEPPQPSPIAADTKSDPTTTPQFSSGCRILAEYEVGKKNDLKEFGAWVGARDESTGRWTVWFDAGDVDFDFDPSEGGWRIEPFSTTDVFPTFHCPPTRPKDAPKDAPKGAHHHWVAPPPLPPPTDGCSPSQQWCFCDERCGISMVPDRTRNSWVGCHACGHWYHYACAQKVQRIPPNYKQLGQFECVDCSEV